MRQFAYDSNSRLIAATLERGFTASTIYGFAGQYIGDGLPDGSSIALDISRDLGLADLGIGLGAQANPAPFGRPENQMAELTDGNGNVTVVRLDEFGQPIEITDPIGRTTTIERNADGLATRVTQPSDGELPDGSTPGQVVTELDYDERGNVTARRQAVGTPLERQTTFAYEPLFNQVTRITDPAGFQTLFAYDPFVGNLLTITDALAGQRSFTYGAGGLVSSQTDQNGNPTAFTYNAAGNLETTTDAFGTVTRQLHDAAGNVTMRIEAEGLPEERTIQATFDAMNRVTSATDGIGAVSLLAYDAAGNLIQTTDATGVVTTQSFDERNRLVGVDSPATGVSTRAYDPNGNLVTVTDALGAITRHEYDAANRRVKTIDALGHERTTVFDVGNNVVAFTDARANTTAFAYDLLDRRISRTNPIGQAWSLGYDSRDNLTNIVDPQGRVVTREFDTLGRLTRAVTVDDDIAVTYDAFGNLTAANDNNSGVSFTYDGLNRLATASTQDKGHQPAVTLTHAYDALSRRTSITDDTGAVVQFGFDAADRLDSLLTPGGGSIALGHDATGRLATIAFPNGVQTAATYDLVSGVLSRLEHVLGALPFKRFDYQQNPLGDITAIADLTEPRTFAYDSLQRLTAGGTVASLESYGYDPEGNRTASHLSASHVVDDANRLLADDAFSYAYDANGNLISKVALAGGAITTYGYNALDQLTRIEFPDLTFAEYAYDAFGRRIEKKVGGVATRYVYDGEDILLEFDGTNILLARYGHGNRIDRPLVMARGGQSYYYHADHQGSIRKVTDAAGTVVNSYDYDSYGNFESTLESVPNPYTYTGREQDPESGLYYYRARYYDPATGRFLQEDPVDVVFGDSNLYRYVGNNPVNRLDPMGLQARALTAGESALVLLVAATVEASLANYGESLKCFYIRVAAVFNPNKYSGICGLGPVMMSSGEPTSGSSAPSTPDSKTATGKDPCKGFRKELKRHEEKLRRYVGDPIAYDNLGRLRNSPFRYHLNIIFGRIGKLLKQLDGFRKALDECERRHGIK